MRIVVAVLLWASVAGAVQWSDEFSVESPRYGQVLAHVGAARVATGGGVKLLVWSDERWGARSGPDPVGPGIFATRIDADGKVMDPAGILVFSGPGDRSPPAVTWDGQQFLIVWRDSRAGLQESIYGARMRADGTVTTPKEGFLISSFSPATEGRMEAPRIATSSGVSLVVWQHGTSGTDDLDILGARVRDDGVSLDPSPRVLVSAAGPQVRPAVVGGPLGFLVTWADGRRPSPGNSPLDIYAARVALSGEVLDPEHIPVSVVDASAQMNPQPLFDGTNYQVMWLDSRDATSHGDVFGGRISLEGKPLDGTGVRITPVHSEVISSFSAAFDGTQTWVVWNTFALPPSSARSSILGGRFGTDGVVKDAEPIPLFTEESSAQLQEVLVDGRGMRGVWLQTTDFHGVKSGRFEMDGRRIDEQGSFIALGANSQGQPRVASTEGSSLLVWIDQIGGEPLSRAEVRAQRLDARGQPTGVVTHLFPGEHRDFPRMTVGGGSGDFLVASSHQGGAPELATLEAQRLRSDGTLIDVQPLGLSKSVIVSDASIARAGKDFLVVWAEMAGITGVMVHEDGSLSSRIPFPKVSTGSLLQLQPQVAFNGTHFLVVWTESFEGIADVRAARVSPTGQLVDVAARVVARTDMQNINPNVAAQPHGDFLVTWTDYSGGAAKPVIRASRMGADGTLKDPGGKQLSAGDVEQRGASRPMFDGSAFTVVWTEGTGLFLGARLARVSLDGVVVTPTPVDVGAGDDHVWMVDLALLAPHKVVVVYPRFDAVPGLYTYRAHGRVATLSEVAPDAGQDAGTGGGTDAGQDAGMGGGADSGQDAGMGGGADAGTDGGADAGGDAGTDSGGDGGSQPDGGGVSQERPGESGCGCSAAGTPLWGVLPWVLMLLWRRSRVE
ncbi:hypothetical protein MYSTI_02113 [Myxococcus stipitatus DSM 14675]|uniref:Uncharacterized protein n=1 Tax=Myxococcus stipitatus (strain DSM 14675 / JCM 12634 / Mx s8) TaxID=1278073 RepID=L7U7C0_MYXSD|nr:hypothetical protein [Myxococcus stipitatus]AGC43442.1 hypothetical protein MYSTI_02113 [Myxococcus stipitatus DSM 14675]